MTSFREIATAVILLALSSTVGVRAESEDGPRRLIVQASELTPELVSAVARLGVSVNVSVPQGADILREVAKRCGTSNARRYYLALFLAANKENIEIASGEVVLKQETNLVFPACLYANESFTAAPVESSGPRWNRAFAISDESVRRATTRLVDRADPAAVAQAEERGLKDAVKYDPASQTSALGATGWVKKIPEQKVDGGILERLAQEPSEKFDDQGPAFIKSFDSNRLDSEVGPRYKRMLDQALRLNAIAVDKELVIQVKAFETAVRTQDIRVANTLVDYTNLQRKSTVLASGYAPSVRSVEIAPNIDRQELVRLIAPAIARDRNLAPAIERERREVPRQNNASACSPGEPELWPINLSELRTVLEYRAAANEMPVRAGAVFVLDSGFPNGGKTEKVPFKKDYFVRSPDGIEREVWSSTGHYYFPGYEQSNHGVNVLALALGGPALMRDKAFYKLIPLSRKVLAYAGYKIDENKRFGVDRDAVARAIDGAAMRDAPSVKGVNLSLDLEFEPLKGKLPEFKDNFSAREGVLFVVAAGNLGINVEQRNVYPARWGGAAAPNVITVAAITPDNTMWDKSNRSEKYVDLAAPGCGVPTLEWDQTNDRFNDVSVDGTSFAAPLVSFAASLLRDLEPTARKSRILGSGHFEEDLVGKTVSARRLDVPVSLAYPFDVLRKADGSMMLGSVSWSDGETFCDESRPKKRVSQVHWDEKTGQIFAVTKPERAGSLDFFSCKVKDTELREIRFTEFIIKDGRIALGESHPYDIRNIRSVTFCSPECYPMEDVRP